jgi:predicted translin family RNA/ssDNA-binding protein
LNACLGKSVKLNLKNKAKKAESVAEVIECLHDKCRATSSYPSAIKKQQQKAR